MTKMIAKQTVKAGKVFRKPGEEFDVTDTETVKALIESGAAEQKTRAVADDSDEPAKNAPKK